MIILSGVLVVVAIALLVAGIVAGSGDSAQVLGVDALVVIYTSIAVSLVSFLCLAIGVFLRRKELFGAVPAPAAAPPRKARSGRKDKKEKKKGATFGRSSTAPAPTAAPAGSAAPGKDAGAPPADEPLDIPVQPANVPDDALVYVVRGRRRYHLDTCRQLAGRDKDELTYIEAKEEGFSPCTACMPDTALAARAAVSVPARSGAQGRSSSSASPAESVAGSGRSSASSATASASAETAPVKPAPDKPAAGKPAAGAGAPPSAWPVPGTASASSAAARPSDGASAQEAAPTTPAKDGSAKDAPSRAAEGGTADASPADTTTTRPISPTAPQGDGPARGEAHADAPAAGDGDGPQVRILSGTKRYHRVDCALIEDIGDEAEDLETLSRAEAVARGCTPCLVCQPDRDQASS
ncbi:hypothetical protein ABZ801_06310 [Actinomadura sp. NPDC047616]|uniref:hypothetical protein n=1 Tax=Actinomadura sp. NPDC047616 TaxID=3155914 RepID=UPI0033DCB15B